MDRFSQHGNASGASLASPSTSSSFVKEGSLATFMVDVIEQSKKTPVLVDFWAPWCGPCKQLGPILEKLVTETNGAVRLVKIDVDKNQQLAMQMRVQSIPAVFAFVDGQPVDGFMGALPESELKKFIGRLKGQDLKEAIDELLKAGAEAYAQKEYTEAVAVYAEILKLDAQNVEAFCGIARCYIALGQKEQAESILQQVPQEFQKTQAFLGAKAAFDLTFSAPQKSSPIGDLAQRLERSPQDHQLRLDLALALHGAGQKEEAMECLLEGIRYDREWNEMAHRKQLLQFFEAWGTQDPLTILGRKKLSSILFA